VTSKRPRWYPPRIRKRGKKGDELRGGRRVNPRKGGGVPLIITFKGG